MQGGTAAAGGGSFSSRAAAAWRWAAWTSASVISGTGGKAVGFTRAGIATLLGTGATPGVAASATDATEATAEMASAIRVVGVFFMESSCREVGRCFHIGRAARGIASP